MPPTITPNAGSVFNAADPSEQLKSDQIALAGYIREGYITLFLMPEDILSIPLFRLATDQHQIAIGESGLLRVEIKEANAITGLVQVGILEVVYPIADEPPYPIMLDGCAAMLTIYPEDRQRFEVEAGR
jgi:hypothetical protein